jgi:hypothetical protein
LFRCPFIVREMDSTPSRARAFLSPERTPEPDNAIITTVNMLSWHIVCALRSDSKSHGKMFSAMFECLNLRQEAHIAAARAAGCQCRAQVKVRFVMICSLSTVAARRPGTGASAKMCHFPLKRTDWHRTSRRPDSQEWPGDGGPRAAASWPRLAAIHAARCTVSGKSPRALLGRNGSSAIAAYVLLRTLCRAVARRLHGFRHGAARAAAGTAPGPGRVLQQQGRVPGDLHDEIPHEFEPIAGSEATAG